MCQACAWHFMSTPSATLCNPFHQTPPPHATSCPIPDSCSWLQLGDGKKVFCKVERSHRKPSTAWWRPTTHQVTFGQGALTVSIQPMQTWLWSGLHVRCMLACEQHACSSVIAHVPGLHAVMHNGGITATGSFSTVPLTVVCTQASNCKQCKVPKLIQRHTNIVHKLSVSFCQVFVGQNLSGHHASYHSMCIPGDPCANCGEAQPCTMASNMVCCAESFRSCHLSACAHQRRCIRVFWGFRSLYTGTTYACGPARPVTASTTGPGSHQPRLKPVIVNPVETHTHARTRTHAHARTHAHMHITSQDMKQQ